LLVISVRSKFHTVTLQSFSSWSNTVK